MSNTSTNTSPRAGLQFVAPSVDSLNGMPDAPATSQSQEGSSTHTTHKKSTSSSSSNSDASYTTRGTGTSVHEVTPVASSRQYPNYHEGEDAQSISLWFPFLTVVILFALVVKLILKLTKGARSHGHVRHKH